MSFKEKVLQVATIPVALLAVGYISFEVYVRGKCIKTGKQMHETKYIPDTPTTRGRFYQKPKGWINHFRKWEPMK